MKDIRITTIIMLAILLSSMFCLKNGLAEFKHSAKQESTLSGIKQDSLIKSTEDITKYFENSVQMRGGGGIVKDTTPLRLEVPFDFNSAELTETAKSQLDNLASAMQSERYSGISIKLAGYTDARGTQEYNLRLSQRRVESAKNYLIRNYNILPGQIYAKGYGESNLIIKDAKSEAEHSVNRRVEISPWQQSTTNDKDNDDVISTHNWLDQEGTKGRSDRFEWGVFHVKDDGSESILKNDGSSTLNSHDKYRLYINPPKPSYVYIYQEDSNGNGSWLFPCTEVGRKNPLNNNDNWIPSRNASFSLDENTGTETIYLVASNNPDIKLEDLINCSGPTPAPRDTITFRIKMRGVAGSVSNESNHNLYMTEIKGDHWDFYVEIKFKHE